MMKLNRIKPAMGAKTKRVRVGRGIGSGLGKTCGRGHKGQKSRAGGYHKTGFEGGQMPLQRRLPKFGFVSPRSVLRDQIRLHELNRLPAGTVDLMTLKKANLIANNIKSVKIFGMGKIDKAFIVKEIKTTKGAQAAIEQAGGKIEKKAK